MGKLPAEKKQRDPERNRNAENHAALLAAVGEGVRISLYPELKILGVRYSRRHLDRLEMEEKFPKRVPLGEGRVGWVTNEVIQHVNRQIESRSLAAGTLGSGDFRRRTKPTRVAPRKAVKAKAKTVSRRPAQQARAQAP